MDYLLKPSVAAGTKADNVPVMYSEYKPSRAAALAALKAFLLQAGRPHTRQRKSGHGPGDRINTVMLSPVIRHRVQPMGKTYVAQADRMVKFTNGRFAPNPFVHGAAPPSEELVAALPIPATPRLSDRLAAIAPVLTAVGITVAPVRGDWDNAAWPGAAKGFFASKHKIPGLIGA